jgi:hypothetical protein
MLLSDRERQARVNIVVEQPAVFRVHKQARMMGYTGKDAQ